MPVGRLLRVGVLMLLAPAGVLVGHGLAYVTAIPDADRRAAVLADTGHAWWALAVPAAAILAVGGIVLALACHLRDEPDRRRLRRDMCAWLAPRLAACQLGLFVVVEVVERMVVGHPLGDLLYHELIEHGVLAQVLVALVLSAVCWCLGLAVDLACVVIARASTPAALPLTQSAGRRPLRPLHRARCPLGARAPPLLVC